MSYVIYKKYCYVYSVSRHLLNLESPIQDTSAGPRDLMEPSSPESQASSGFPQPTVPVSVNSSDSESRISSISRFASGFGFRLNLGSMPADEKDNGNPNTLESLAKGLVGSSVDAVRSMQVKARHIVSQNKRRFQSDGFDLDLTYITENIVAMGFPAGDMSSGLFGYFEGLYRNHMEDVFNFLETRHKGKYKVYNICSERLYDASKFHGKVASFPFDNYNCPSLELISSFCQSAQSWLKDNVDNVVVVHCKTGLGRTGLMISCLLLYLECFVTAEEAIDHFNQKRCVDAKGLVLPSQIRYVHYFHRLLKDFHGEVKNTRRCVLRGFRLHRCPYWLRPSITISDLNGVLFSSKNHPKTKNLMPEDFWLKAPKRNMVVFALPGEPGITHLSGDVKIHFHDSQGEFYCWFNPTFSENRTIFQGSQLDGFDKRKIPSPGFHVEIVMVDNSAKTEITTKPDKTNQNDDDVFSDSDEESKSKVANNHIQDSTKSTEQFSVGTHELASTDIKAMAADASVFTFAEEDDFECE